MRRKKHSDLDSELPHFDENGQLTIAYEFNGLKRGRKISFQAELGDSFRVKHRGKVVYIPKIHFATNGDGPITNERKAPRRSAFQEDYFQEDQ